MADSGAGVFLLMANGKIEYIECACAKVCPFIKIFSLGICRNITPVQQNIKQLKTYFKQLPEFDNVYCRYQYVFGPDWDIASGLEEGLTSTMRKGFHQDKIVVNHPVDVGFKSTSPSDWPKLIVHVYGYDTRGADIVRGYGIVHIPVLPGRHTLKIGLFVPEQPSRMKRFLDWIKGTNPEFIDPRVLNENEGRQVTRVRTQGTMTLTFNILLKDFSAMGYDIRSSSMSVLLPS